MEERNKKNYTSAAEALGIALAGALIFTVIHVPLPWLLGPIVAVMIWRLATGRILYWPSVFRDIASFALVTC